MSEDYKRNLWVLKFALKLVYPSYNVYLFLVYLIIKYRTKILKQQCKGNMLKLESIPSELLNSKISNLGNRHSTLVSKCLLISERNFLSLAAENHFYIDNAVLWMSLCISPETKQLISKKHNTEKSKKQLRYDLELVTAELHRKLWNDRAVTIDYNKQRVVPVIISKCLSDDIAYTTENEYSNILSSFGIDNNINKVSIVLRPIMSMELSPKIAADVEIHMVLNQFDISNDFVKEILNNYFKTPKLLCINDIFSIELEPDVTGKQHFKYLDLVDANSRIYFQCRNINSNSEEKDPKIQRASLNCDVSYFVVKGVTQLTLGENIHAVTAGLKNVSGAMLESCPLGLKKYFTLINESLYPFIVERECRSMQNSLVNPIIPIFLLTGAVGSGRHLILRTLARYNGMNLLVIDCNSVQSSTAKQTESKINAMVQKAKASSPVFVLMDNFEVFAVDAENNEDCRVLEYFIESIQTLYQNYTKQPIFFFAVTEKSDLKPNILRIFLEKYHITKPNDKERFEILEWFTLAMQLEPSENENIAQEKNRLTQFEQLQLKVNAKQILERLSAKTQTFSYGDLDTLVHFALRNSFLKQHESLTNSDKEGLNVRLVQEPDYDAALETMRSLQSQHMDAPKIPKVYWQDIGGLDKLKKELMKTIEFPIKYPHLFKNSALKRSGILLYGPPGCGKTLVAKAVSTELNVSFLSVKGPELLNMYIGQSEENVRRVFESARAASPCIVFLDELDALAPRRGAAGDSGGASDRVVSQLLAEVDGVTDGTNEDDDTSFVFIMGATNRPDLLEQSLLRPGRLDKLIYVGPYSGLEEKTKVLQALCLRHNLSSEVSLQQVAAKLPPRCTGADLMQVVTCARAAAVRAHIHKLHSGEIKESELSSDNLVIGMEELWDGVRQFRPSVTDDELRYYENLQTQMS